VGVTIDNNTTDADETSALQGDPGFLNAMDGEPGTVPA
jgi:hypothetical protein